MDIYRLVSGENFFPFFSNARKNVSLHDFRTEPQCITCDGDILFSSRFYYNNCSHFGAYVAPQSSISTDAGVDYYILECRGPGLPLAGEFFFMRKMLKNSKLSEKAKTFQLEKLREFSEFSRFKAKLFFLGTFCECSCA